MLISNIDGQVHATWEALLAELLGPLLHDCIAQAHAAQNTATGLLQQQMGAAIDSMVLQPPDVSAPMSELAAWQRRQRGILAERKAADRSE